MEAEYRDLYKSCGPINPESQSVWESPNVCSSEDSATRNDYYHWAKRPLGLRHFAQQMEVIRHQRIGQDPYAAKGLQPSHQERKSFGLWGTVAGGLENELTVDHSGKAVVKTLTLSLDAREPHGSEADYTKQRIKV